MGVEILESLKKAVVEHDDERAVNCARKAVGGG